jgi:hypothetical protein
LQKEHNSGASAHDHNGASTEQLHATAAAVAAQQDADNDHYDSEADDQCAQHYSSHHIFATYASSVPPASTLTANFKQSGGPRAYPYTAAPVTTVSSLLSACMNSTASMLTAANSFSRANGHRKTVEKAVGKDVGKGSSRPVTARTAYVQCCEELYISPLPLFDGLQQQQQYTVAVSPLRVTSTTGATAGATTAGAAIGSSNSTSSVDFSGRLAAHKQPLSHTANANSSGTGSNDAVNTAQQQQQQQHCLNWISQATA